MLRIAKGLTLCSLMLALASSSSRGDIPLPPNLRYIDPIVRFEGIAKLPEYEFRLRFQTFTGGPSGTYTYRPVVEGNAFNLNAQRRLLDMQLLGLKRDEFERRAKADPSLRWLTDETPHVLAADVPSPSTVGKSTEKVPVTNYRVSLKDGKLVVERVADEEKKAGVAPPSGTWIAGIALALAIAGSGLWLGRGVRFAALPWRRPAHELN